MNLTFPLTDNTEARYAEVAREMVRTGDWISPRLFGAPFWSKPPLSIWMVAGSFKLFGMNEFAARLPSLFMMIGSIWLLYILARKQADRTTALGSAVVLSTCAGFFLCTGTVMTDSYLLFGLSLSMLSFWLAMNKGRRIWGYLFFIGISIGLMAKGPVALVLTIFPVMIWILINKKWNTAWHSIPWVSGSLLMMAVTLPWYILAEIHTPGFLNYFIIGEHWKRFTTPGWVGDKYGNAHIQPRGFIWLCWIAGAFPWSIIIIGFLGKIIFDRKYSGMKVKEYVFDQWRSYLLVWALWPMVFFTMARNILWTYIVPGLPAMAIIMSTLINKSGIDEKNTEAPTVKSRKRKYMAGLITPMVFLILLPVYFRLPIQHSHVNLIKKYFQERGAGKGDLVYYMIDPPPYSAVFYSENTLSSAGKMSDLDSFLKDGKKDFYVFRYFVYKQMPPEFKNKVKLIGKYEKDYGLFVEK